MDDEPDMKGKLVVFDPQVFRRTNQLLRDWTANRNQWQSLFGQWKEQFNADTPEVRANVERENNYLKYLRDGGFERTLAGLRTRERQADMAEKENALDFAEGGVDKSRLLGGGGRSSADFARRLAAGKRIEAEYGGRDLARERGDLNWTNTMKLGTLGRINANIEALNNRTLMPQQLSDRELMGMIGALGGIQGIRMGSASPVFWRERSDLEKTADVLDSLAEGYYKGMSVYSQWAGGGMMGGMGGGAGKSGGGAPQGGGMENLKYQEEMMNGPQSGQGFNYQQYQAAPYDPWPENFDTPAYQPSWMDTPTFG